MKKFIFIDKLKISYSTPSKKPEKFSMRKELLLQKYASEVLIFGKRLQKVKFYKDLSISADKFDPM